MQLKITSRTIEENDQFVINVMRFQDLIESLFNWRYLVNNTL
jgi:hypothetical protein